MDKNIQNFLMFSQKALTINEVLSDLFAGSINLYKAVLFKKYEKEIVS